MSNRINKMKKSSKKAQKNSQDEIRIGHDEMTGDEIRHAIYKALEEALFAMWNKDSISENGEHAEIAVPINVNFYTKNGEPFCAIVLATPRENVDKFGFKYIDPNNIEDVSSLFSDEDEIELTDEVIEQLSTEGIDGEKYSKEKLLTLRSAGMTHYNTKRKSFVDTTEFID